MFVSMNATSKAKARIVHPVRLCPDVQGGYASSGVPIHRMADEVFEYDELVNPAEPDVIVSRSFNDDRRPLLTCTADLGRIYSLRVRCTICTAVSLLIMSRV